MTVEKSQIGENTGSKTRLAEAERIRSNRRRHRNQWRAWPRSRQHRRCAAVAHGHADRRGMDRCKFCGAGKNFAWVGAHAG